MPVLVPVITAVASAAGAYIGGTAIFGLTVLESSILIGVGSLGLSLISNALSPKPKTPTLKEALDRGITQLIRGSSEPRKVIYGERPISGVLVFAEVTGTSNEFLHLVIALAGHQSESIGTVFFNKEGIDDSDLDGSGNVISGHFAGRARIKKHLGYEIGRAHV